jgi:hypothetical protein
MYVGEHDKLESEIFAHTMETVSPHFREFLFGFGYFLDIENNQIVFSGGLDVKFLGDGKTSVFYHDINTDIMFHVSPLMPAEHDNKNIKHKRHIGNDNVNIVWNENVENYDLQTISSQFNHVILVVSPLSNGMFSVIPLKNAQDMWVSPIQSPVVMPKSFLPHLVRQTSIESQIVAGKKFMKHEYPPAARFYELEKLRDQISHK